MRISADRLTVRPADHMAWPARAGQTPRRCRMTFEPGGQMRQRPDRRSRVEAPQGCVSRSHPQAVASAECCRPRSGRRYPDPADLRAATIAASRPARPRILGRRDLGSMYDESLPTSGYGYACSATPSSDSPATPGAAGLGPRPGLSFGLIHPRTGPFTGGHPDRVRAARGRWRTPVNSMQHCWTACWGQPLRSSNLLSSATADLRRCGQIRVGAALPPTACVSFSVSV